MTVGLEGRSALRLWSVHPKYLDAIGLVALWREALLAQAVLRGKTRGYRHHPQIARFKKHARPRSAINAYLRVVYDEACARGYDFDGTKLGCARGVVNISVTSGQMACEWKHLLAKLATRSPTVYAPRRLISRPLPHPLFRVHRGGIEKWERTRPAA